MLCEELYQALLKRDNVDIKLGSLVTGYTTQPVRGAKKASNVTSLNVNFEKDELAADKVVLCLGAQARVHIKQHFDTVLPMISAQGYSMDLPDTQKKYDNDMHLKLGDRGYAYAQLEPGKHRIVAFMDFGVHD